MRSPASTSRSRGAAPEEESSAKVEAALAQNASLEVASRVVMSRGLFKQRPFRWRGRWQVGRMPEGAPIAFRARTRLESGLDLPREELRCTRRSWAV